MYLVLIPPSPRDTSLNKSQQEPAPTAEVNPAGQALHALCKAEFQPFSAAGLRSKHGLVHGDKKQEKR